MDQDQAPSIVDYEKYREERIKSNMERMRQLGLLNLSRHLNTTASASAFHQTPTKSKIPTDESKKKKKKNKNKKVEHLTPPLPSRRSSRLENMAHVNYTEARGKKSHEKSDHVVVIEELDGRGELYTEEHEKLLGSCEVPWTLFVDGYDKNKKRIYDSLKGKTCHQCRQKTMGYHTSCCKCQLVKGQFCGDCLYMRYGENVLEAIKKPDWICPVCRGICNCSLCRLKKGWKPTRTLYNKVVNLGYKSVAHYLIQTRQKPSNSNSDSEIKAAMSDSTEAAKEKEPELIISDEKLGDESSGIND
ncbi:uncharacterized protein LOC144554430 [Carex rostrata]